MNGTLKVFAGREGLHLARDICTELDITLGQATIGRFNDGEPHIEIKENVRGEDVYIVAPTRTADALIETVALAKAARYSSAGRVTLVIPYLYGNRQDRKDKPRTPVTAKIAIDLLKLSEADHVLLLDAHSEATLPHFEPMVYDHLYASTICVPYLRNVIKRPFVIATPDNGGIKRARTYSDLLGLGQPVIFDKHRTAPGKVGRVTITGRVRGKSVLFVDDLIDTGGTIIADAEAAKKAGAKDIYVFATHAVFSGAAPAQVRQVINNLDKSVIKEIVVTDTIRHDPELVRTRRLKLTVLGTANLLARGIRRLHDGRSLSELFLKSP